jgi:hypothetical protein
MKKSIVILWLFLASLSWDSGLAQEKTMSKAINRFGND